MTRQKIQILFKHPVLRGYRVPFFQGIVEKFQVKFLFNRVPAITDFPFVYIGTTKKSMWLDFRATRNFLRELIFSNYDIFITSTPKASASILGIKIAKFRKRKVIVWEESWCYPTKMLKSKVTFFLLHPVFNIPNAFFITSTKTLELNQEIKRRDPSQLFLAPQCSLDYSKFNTIPIDLNNAQGKKIILYLSRIIYLKGLDVLIRAYSVIKKKDKDTLLLIVGDGDFKEECESLALSLNLKDCLFYGSVAENNYELKASLYQLCDVFVLPSRFVKSRSEGWGIVVNEAMSMSKPVVVTDAVGCSDDMVQHGGNGYVVKYSSVKEITEAILKVLRNENKRKKMGEISRKIFDENNQYQKMIKVFNDAVRFALES